MILHTMVPIRPTVLRFPAVLAETSWFDVDHADPVVKLDRALVEWLSFCDEPVVPFDDYVQTWKTTKRKMSEHPFADYWTSAGYRQLQQQEQQHLQRNRDHLRDSWMDGEPRLETLEQPSTSVPAHDKLATNVCIRAGLERFVSPPGTSTSSSSSTSSVDDAMIVDDVGLGSASFWKQTSTLFSTTSSSSSTTSATAATTSSATSSHNANNNNNLGSSTSANNNNNNNNDEDKLNSSPSLATHDEMHQHSPLKHHQMSICAGCRMEINDRYILRVNPNLEFHAECLKCCECRRQLDESCTAFVRNGQTYCKDDYFRLYGTKCSRCSRVFDRAEMVMKAGHLIYHLGCFCCAACSRRLQTGEEFQFKNNMLYCRIDCDPGNAAESSGPATGVVAGGVPAGAATLGVAGNSQLYDEDSWETSTLTSLDHTSPPLSIRSPKSDGMATPQNGYQNSSGSSSGGSGKKKKDKQTTRVRTVLNESQLKILKQCYSMNSRPDAQMKENLVEMTGLNARVIRVWFQNKRCKDKKRQIQIHESRMNAEKELALSGVRMGGIGPLIAAAPTTHVDSMSHNGPLEIAHYPQPWAGHPHAMDPAFAPHPGGHMSYTDLSYGMGAAGAASLPPPPPSAASGYADFSPHHMHHHVSSNLSSPSCSE